MWHHKQSVKEVLRHIAYNIGVPEFLDANRKSRGYASEHLNLATPAEKFVKIYKIGAWRHSHGQSSLSGTGSELSTTQSVRIELPQLVQRLGCRTFLDVGCGDWNWMGNVALPCDYLGIDIVPEVIERNRMHLRAGVSFAVADAISDPLPKADIAFCREVLFHLSFEDALLLLGNIRRSAEYLVATTDRVWFNSDIRTGDFRMINLQLRPYQLPPPQYQIKDDENVAGRILGVWRASEIPEFQH